MATSGSVAFMFKKRALFAMERGSISEDDMMDFALENGADDVTTDDPEIYGIDGPPEEYMNLVTAFAAKEWVPMDAGLRYVPDNYIPIDADAAEKLQTMIDLLEDDEDVQAVHHNAEFPE